MGQYENHRGSGRVVFDDDAFQALGSALQKSTHVTAVEFNISDITTIQGFSTMEAFLKSTKSLRRVLIYSEGQTKRQQLTGEITNRFLAALHQNRNSSVQELAISTTNFSCKTLSHLLTKLNPTLQKLKLEDVALTSETDSFVHDIGKAIYKCQSLQEIDLTVTDLQVAFMESTLTIGICNHQSLQRLRLQFLKEMPDHVARALRHAFQFSGPHLRTLELWGFYVTPIILQSIIDGLLLQTHPVLQNLKIYCCQLEHSMAVQALTKLLSASNVKLQTLELFDSIDDPRFLNDIIRALHDNTSIQKLDLRGYGQDIQTITLFENLLARPNNSISHLSLPLYSLGSNQGAKLVRTGIQTLVALDCRICDTFVQALATSQAPPPSNLPNPLQKIRLRGDDITDQGMSCFLSYLQQHATQLKCLRFVRSKFGSAGAARLKQFLQDNHSLEQVFFEGYNASDDTTFQTLLNILSTAMSRHSTLKSLGIYRVELQKYQSLFCMLETMIPNCQLTQLEMHAFWPDSSNRDDDERDGCISGLLEAFDKNMTLTDVTLSADDDMFSTVFHKQLAYYGKRNAYFLPLLQTDPQPIMASDKQFIKWDFGDDDDDFKTDDDNNGVRTCCVRSGSTAKFPLGVWPHILEAAHKQYPHASVIYQLLFSQFQLICAGAWERSIPSKRDYSQISS